jgi:hypothetical protein
MKGFDLMKPDGVAALLAGFAVLGTVLGMVVRGWSSVKNFLASIFRFVVVEIHLDGDQTSQAVLAYLVQNYKRSRFHEKTYGGKHEWFRDGRFGHVAYEHFGKHAIMFWVKTGKWAISQRPLWFSASPEKPDEKQVSVCWGARPTPIIRSSVFCLRGTVDVDTIVANASRARNELYWANGISAHKRFFIRKIPNAAETYDHKFSAGTTLAWYYEGVYRLLAHTPNDLGRSSATPDREIDKLFFPDHVLSLIHEIELWRGLREWYLERGIPWKRGWLLYGPPGTGKSAIVRAVAHDMDMPLFAYSLGCMLNEDLERSWAEMQAHIPCVALFEDFDNVFHARENVYGKPNLSDLIASAGAKGGGDSTAAEPAVNTGRLSFDCFLNCLDGVEKSNGVFTVITTNHVDVLDPALGKPVPKADGGIDLVSTRPGRIDKAIELGYMLNSDKLKLAQRILFDNERGLAEIRRQIEREPDRKETPAQFQERCTQLALDMLWAQRKHAHRGNGHAHGNGRIAISSVVRR